MMKDSSCPECAVAETSLSVTNPAVAAEWHPHKNGDITPSQVGADHVMNAWWLCPKGHEYQATVRSRARGSRTCASCYGGWSLEHIRAFVKSLLTHVAAFNPSELFALAMQAGVFEDKKSRPFVMAIATGRFPREELEKFAEGKPSLVDEFAANKALTLEIVDGRLPERRAASQRDGPGTDDGCHEAGGFHLFEFYRLVMPRLVRDPLVPSLHAIGARQIANGLRDARPRRPEREPAEHVGRPVHAEVDPRGSHRGGEHGRAAEERGAVVLQAGASRGDEGQREVDRGRGHRVPGRERRAAGVLEVSEQRGALSPEQALERQLGGAAADGARHHLPCEPRSTSCQVDGRERDRARAWEAAEEGDCLHDGVAERVAHLSHRADDRAIKGVAALAGNEARERKEARERAQRDGRERGFFAPQPPAPRGELGASWLRRGASRGIVDDVGGEQLIDDARFDHARRAAIRMPVLVDDVSFGESRVDTNVAFGHGGAS
jgi:hypothetical protein